MAYQNLDADEERRAQTDPSSVKDAAATHHDVTEGGLIGAVGGAVVGALAGGPVGAIVGAILGGVASATAVEAVDQHDHNAVPDTVPDTVPVPLPNLTSASAPEILDQTQYIRERAYALYEQRGYGDGLDVQDWLIAEREITPF